MMLTKPMKLTLILPEEKARYTISDLIELYNTYFAEHKNANVEYRKGIELYSSLEFRAGEFTRIKVLPPRFDLGACGLRIIDDISLVRKHHINAALRGYFQLPADEFGNSSFALGRPLIYEVIRLIDLKAKIYKSSPSKRTPMVELILPENITQRLKTSDELPYHGFVIPYEKITESLDNLSEEYYLHLHLWFWSEARFKLPEPYLSEYLKYRKYKRTRGKKYHKARRLREYSLKQFINLLVRP